MNTKQSSGFTIVELVIVIIIIGILVAIGIASYGRVQTESRDAQRASATKLIMNSFEKYYEKNGEYPYTKTLNPTQNLVEMPDYNATIATLPELTPEILQPAGYKFFAWSCASGTDCVTPADKKTVRSSQIFYYTQPQGSTNSTIYNTSTNGLWGCRISLPSDSTPAGVIILKEEATGKWNFYRTQHGSVSIENYGTGPVAPTVCAFS